jgi:DNA repair exonuclease SbcCD ATPase subunit
MTQDVRQWLSEIKALQQQLAEAEQERDTAYTSATNWRRLYETEAQQRRAEANLAQQAIADLQTEIQQLRGGIIFGDDATHSAAEMTQALDQLQTPAELREKLGQILQEQSRLQGEVEQLVQALHLEQANHAQTRKSLTTALGDTIDLLTKERAIKQVEKSTSITHATGADLTSGNLDLEATKSPLLELPPLNQAQFPV